MLWVVDFPAFEYNEGERRWDAVHHPSPPRRATSPTRGRCARGPTTSILDGSEIGGGSIRIHRSEVQQEVFRVLGISEQEADERFGFLLDAMRYGAPPHGGIAFGLDRVAAIVADRDSIRDVIAFPKTASGADPLTGAPAPVDAPQLAELGLRLAAPPPAGDQLGARVSSPSEGKSP